MQAMSSPTHGLFARSAPIFGAALVISALGALVWALSAGERTARPDQGFAPQVRGAPIRSQVQKPSAPKPAVVPAKSAARKSDKPSYQELTFALLSGYDYPKSGSLQAGAPAVPAELDGQPPPQPDVPPQPTKVPEELRAFDGVQVEITGFMNPIEFDRDGVKSFALTAIPGGCCYGAIPRLNEWVVVRMPGEERAEYAYYDPVTIFGELSVGELYEDGVVLSLYRMTPDKIDVGF
jgi:hypothetical protein